MLLRWSRVQCKGHVQGMAPRSIVVLQVRILPEAEAGVQGKRCGVDGLDVQVGALNATALLLGNAEGLLQAQAGVGPACKQAAVQQALAQPTPPCTRETTVKCCNGGELCMAARLQRSMPFQCGKA